MIWEIQGIDEQSGGNIVTKIEAIDEAQAMRRAVRRGIRVKTLVPDVASNATSIPSPPPTPPETPKSDFGPTPKKKAPSPGFLGVGGEEGKFLNGEEKVGVVFLMILTAILYLWGIGGIVSGVVGAHTDRLDDLGDALVHQNTSPRFKDDNAIGATANALEDAARLEKRLARDAEASRRWIIVFLALIAAVLCQLGYNSILTRGAIRRSADQSAGANQRRDDTTFGGG